MLDARLSHVALGVADIDAARRFYEDHVGLVKIATREDARERLSFGLGAHVLELAAGARIDHFALELPGPAQLEALVDRLDRHGVKTTTVSAGGDHPAALAFSDPDGHRAELHERIDRSGEGLGTGGRKPQRLHHITLSTENVGDLVDFYVSAVVLGCAISDRMGERFAWLRCNREHPTIAIVEGVPGGLDHYCFEVRDWDELKYWWDELSRGDVLVSWGPGRHGPGNNLFIMFDDSDRVHIELWCEMERFWDRNASYPEPRMWTADLRTVNLWGPSPERRRPLQRSAVDN